MLKSLLPGQPVSSLSAQARPALSPVRHAAAKTRSRARALAIAALALAAGYGAAHAQASFGSVALGASTSAAVTVTAQTGGTVSTVEVLTRGASGMDFTAASGGTCSGATLSAGQQCSQPVVFQPAYPGIRTGAVVLLDSSRNVLGTVLLSGSGSGGLGALFPGTAQTVAGDGRWQDAFVGDGNPATKAELFLPSAVALDGAGNLYIADSNHNRIRMVCAGTTATIAGTTCTGANVISTIAGLDGTSGYAGDGSVAGTSHSVQLNLPSGLAIDGAGNLYISDSANDVIRKITAATGIITTIAGNHTPGYGGDGGPAAAAELYDPFGLALDPSGNLYIADIGNNRVRAICAAAGTLDGVACPAPGAIVTLAGKGTANISGDGGLAVAAELDGPYAVAVDPAGNLFIADTQNNRVRAVCATANGNLLGAACTAAGIISTVAGNGTGNFAGDGAAATAAEVNSPSGLAFDPAGNLYIADTQNYRIREVSGKNGIITTIAGNGSTNFGGDNGPATTAGIHGPYGITLDPNGNILVADFFDQRIREIQTNFSQVNVTLPVRQGYTSDPVSVMVANNGTATLGLTSIDPTGNTAVDPASTTCPSAGTLNVLEACVVGVEFAPAKTPTLSSNQAEDGTVNVNDESQAGVTGSNSPLAIHVTGTATPVNATDVALTSKPNPSTFGQNVTFTATVTTGSGTGALTGTVTFFDGANKISPDTAIDTNGVATFTISTLTVGTHPITAAYNGDTGHFSSTSPEVDQVVNEATATVLVSSADPSALNQSVTFTATVNTAGGVTPDGTVTFMDGTTVLTTVPLAAGAASYTMSTLSDGIHPITAVYSGDAAIYVLGSTSNVVKQDVLAGSTVVVASSVNPSTYGTSVTFTATVTANGTTAPTGTVNFLDGATRIGSATLVGTTGVATFPTSALGVGSHTITAAYVGNSNDGPGTSPAITQVVNQAETGTVVSASPTPGIAGKPVVLTANVTLTAGTAALSGTVTFTDGTATLGTGTVSSAGTATLNYNFAPGVHSIVATYGGSTNAKGSVSGALSLTVNQATTSVALSSSGSPAQVLSAVQFKAKVSGNGGTPTGTVTFSVDGASIGSSTVDGTGTATFSDAGLAVGNHTVTASYGGDTNDAGSASTALSQVITAIPTSTNLGISSTNGTDPQTILVATASATTGPIPTGTITFKEGTTVVGSSAVGPGGVATLVPDLTPGNHDIVASYGGDALHSPSESASVSIKGGGTGFSVVVDPSSLNLVSGQNGTVKVSIVSNNGFSDDIGMGCLSLPAAVNCHFSSHTVKLGADTVQTVELTIDTNAPLSGGSSAQNVTGSNGMSLAGLFLPASLLFGGWFWRLRRKHGAALLGVALCFLAGAMSLTGCGASFSQSSAQPGTYTIQVGGVGSGSNTSHYQNVTLTVTK